MNRRVVFLLVLAIAITLLFLSVIGGFALALLLAAVFAGVASPFHRRLTNALGGRTALASGLTVGLSVIVVIIPLLLFLFILAGQAVDISESAHTWFTQQTQESGSLREQVAEHPELSRLLPYQDEIIARAGELAGKAGSFVAEGLATGAKMTAEFLLSLFVMLYAMFCFLMSGRTMLDTVFRYTPLSGDDRDRLLGTFASVGRATLKGTLIIGIVQGGLAGLSFWVAGIPGAVFWGAVMAVLSIIPGIGAALVWVPAVIFLILDGRIEAAVGVGLWCAVVVGTADNFLRPVLIGKDTQMPDLLVLLTTLGGLALFGAAGILVGPIIGALFLTIWRLWGSAIDAEGGRDQTCNNTELTK